MTYVTTSGSEFCAQVSSTSPLPPPVTARSPCTCPGAAFAGVVGELLGVAVEVIPDDAVGLGELVGAEDAVGDDVG